MHRHFKKRVGSNRIYLRVRGHSTTTWTKFWPPTSLEWTIVDILCTTYLVPTKLTTYPLFTWPSMDFLLTTCLPVLVHVVIKWPLTTLQRHNKVSLSMYRSISLLTLWFDKSQLYDNIRWFIKVNVEGTILKM